MKNTNLKIMHRLTAEDDRNYMGETMGLDASQKHFATRLATGEALVYADALPEALQIGIRPELTSSSPQVPVPQATPPFDGCATCRAQCQYRGAALAMVRDASLIGDVVRSVRSLEQSGTSRDEKDASWSQLLESLRSRVRAFPALPADDPGLSDAAYCVFLHSLASQRMHFAPAWSHAMAERLALATGTAHLQS